MVSEMSVFDFKDEDALGKVLVIPHNFLNEINMTRENRP